MTKSVKWNFSIYVEDGPILTSSENMNVEAVDVVSVTVAENTNANPVIAEIQPGELDEIKLIYIKLKSGPKNDVKYNVTEDETDPGNVADALTLDKDHILTSGELVSLLPKTPKWIAFFNGNANTPAEVEVVVARSATAA